MALATDGYYAGELMFMKLGKTKLPLLSNWSVSSRVQLLNGGHGIHCNCGR